MWARWLADGLVVLHLAFVAFVVLGGLAAWRWRPVAYLHVPAALWGVWIELSGGVCPLTPFENRLRVFSGQMSYEGDFVQRYLMPVVYPTGLTREIQIALGVAVIVLNVTLYALMVRRRSQGQRPKTPTPAQST
ncbi:MAG: DUF2784 domain-containing protein [Acidobacteriota bacterium]